MAIKKWLKRIALVPVLLIGLIVLYFCFFLFVGPICNDIKASFVQNQMRKSDLPLDTKLIDIDSDCLNSGGTGNHIEIMVGMLIYSELPKKEVLQFYSDIEYVFTLPDDEADSYPFHTLTLDDIIIHELSDGYYLLVNFYDSFTQSDIRGF